ncbi:MAG: hypothetical protein HC880_06785 [Bacteroidia bacterium]|nr:hypothetical protein [Bacteroidia bacterium]
MSLGYGNTFFGGVLREKEEINDQRGFGRNDGLALSAFYYWAPQKLNGWGVGLGMRAFKARSNEGGQQETYSYDYYHVGLGVRDYFISHRFNEGLYFKVNFGLGQGREKMEFEALSTEEVQNAFGYTALGGLGYAIPLTKRAWPWI